MTKRERDAKFAEMYKNLEASRAEARLEQLHHDIELLRSQLKTAERQLVAAAIPFTVGDWVIAVKDVPDIHCKDNSPLVKKGQKCFITSVELNGCDNKGVRSYDLYIDVYYCKDNYFKETIQCVTPAFLSKYFKKAS